MEDSLHLFFHFLHFRFLQPLNSGREGHNNDMMTSPEARKEKAISLLYQSSHTVSLSGSFLFSDYYSHFVFAVVQGHIINR